MRLARLFTLVHNSPWAILPEKHAVIRKLLADYANQKAFDEGDLPDEAPSPFDVIGKTAVVPIEGVILNKASGLETMCGAFSLDTFKKTLKAVGARDDVQNVVLNVASPGGMVMGLAEATDVIKALALTKNVVAYSNDVTASAAYWLACNAKRLFVSQSAQVGSIGVYVSFVDESKAFEKQGLEVQVFKGGNSKFKAMELEGTSLTPDQKAYIQEGVDKAYASFVSLVKANRPKVTDDALSGKVFDGNEAVANGLADGIVSELDDLITYLNR